MKELSEAKLLDRKRDARQKIELGGLVVKAGLRDADRAFVLGVLLEAAAHQPNSSEHKRLTKLGKDNFSK